MDVTAPPGIKTAIFSTYSFWNGIKALNCSATSAYVMYVLCTSNPSMSGTLVGHVVGRWKT